MTASQLEAIRVRVRQASDGPWTVRRIPNSFPSQAGDRYTHPCVRGFRVPRRIYDLAWQQCEADAEFIAHARMDVPSLIEEIEALRATLRECKRAIAELLESGEGATANDLARIEQFIVEEDAGWEDAGEKIVRGRRLYMSPPQLRPRRGAATVIEIPQGDARKPKIRP
jgi:hypothetical protein